MGQAVCVSVREVCTLAAPPFYQMPPCLACEHLEGVGQPSQHAHCACQARNMLFV